MKDSSALPWLPLAAVCYRDQMGESCQHLLFISNSPLTAFKLNPHELSAGTGEIHFLSPERKFTTIIRQCSSGGRN